MNETLSTASYRLCRSEFREAGRADTLFSDDATALSAHSPGLTRACPAAVNNLVLQALVAAYATNKAIVDESSARAATPCVDVGGVTRHTRYEL